MRFHIPKKERNELIILTIVAVACLVYILFRPNGKMNYSLPEFSTVKMEDLTAVQVESSQQERLKFEKVEDRWLMADGYPASTSQVEQFLKILSKPEPVDLVSQQGKSGRYDLDDKTRYVLTGYKDDEVSREIYVGKSSSSNRYTYVAFPDVNGIYTIRGNLPDEFNRDVENFRDKVILEIDRDAITQIGYVGNNINIQISKKDDGSWADKNGQVWETEKINELLGRFVSLRASKFFEDKTQWPVESEKTVEITLNGKQLHKITFYTKQADGYPVQTSAYPFPVLIAEYGGNSILDAFTTE